MLFTKKIVRLLCIVVLSLFTVYFTSELAILSVFNGYKRHHKTAISSSAHVEQPILYDYAGRYKKFLNECLTEYTDEPFKLDKLDGDFTYPYESTQSLQKKQIRRAFLFYFPIKQFDYFIPEFKWLYRSWIQMLKNECKSWRTDLILFVDTSSSHDKQHKEKFQVFDELDCKMNRLRKHKNEKSMCILIDYTAIKDRDFGALYKFKTDPYDFMYNQVDVYSDEQSNLHPFYSKLKDLGDYGYVDSIVVAFEGYKHIKDTYDFVVRSDMDIFMTPLFGKWLPRKCNDFIHGNGGYSTPVNTKRLARIASDLKMKYANVEGLGSTWFSTPRQFRLVAYLTLVSMVYLNENEFTGPERKSEISYTKNLPDWHHDALLYYGQHLAMNHLIATDQVNLIKLRHQFDRSSTSDDSIENIVHIHQYFYETALFSKLKFKDGVYDNMTVSENQKKKVRFYCLWLALESKTLTTRQLRDLKNNL